MTSSAYVFVEGLDAEPVICGKFELNSRISGSFRQPTTYYLSATRGSIA